MLEPFTASATGIMSIAGTQSTTSTSSFATSVSECLPALQPHWESCSFSSYQNIFSCHFFILTFYSSKISSDFLGICPGIPGSIRDRFLQNLLICRLQQPHGSSFPSRNSRKSAAVKIWPSCLQIPADLQLLRSPPPADDGSSVCLSQAFRHCNRSFCQSRVLKYTHGLRSIQRSLQILLHLHTILQSSLRYPGLPCLRGIASTATADTSISASMGFGKSAAIVVSTGSRSFLPSFSALSIISLQ